MTFFKTDLPKLLSKKNFKTNTPPQEIPSLNGEHQADAAIKTEATPRLEGIICYLELPHNQQLIASHSFEILFKSLDLMEQLQSFSKDGKSGLPLQLHPQFEQKDSKVGFWLVGELHYTKKAKMLLQKMRNHLYLLETDQAAPHHLLAPKVARAYQQLLELCKQYRQSIQFIESHSQKSLFYINHAAVDTLIQTIKGLHKMPKKLQLIGKISGFSQHTNTLEFLVASDNWHGIKTKKTVYHPIQTKASKSMVALAKKYMNQEVELEILKQIDLEGNAHYQIHSILIKTTTGILKERLVYEGPRGGQYHLNYMGKKVYLPKSTKQRKNK